MLNLSSNDYLGLASRQDLQEEFQASTQDRFYPYSSSSSRLLTGNFSVYTKLEKQDRPLLRPGSRIDLQ